MKKQIHIALLSGGLSNEREASLSSGEFIHKALKELGYKVTKIDMTRSVFNDITDIKPDLVYNSLHGKYGEDGCIPGLLEIAGIAYTHSGILASSTAINKQATKNIAKSCNIRCVEGKLLSRKEIINQHPMERPYIVKPLFWGSSRGILIIKENEEPISEDLLTKECDEFLVEKYIKGQEIFAAVTDEKPLGLIEVSYKGDFFDYECKYNGETDYIYPPNIEKHIYDETMESAFKMHKAIGCSPISRSDYIYDGNNVYLLEVNTHPGFTETSFFPKIALYNNISFNEIVDYIVKKAL